MSERSREHEQQYQAIFEATSDGLVINDAETGLILEANPAFCRMHGYDNMTGLHPTTFIHPSSHHLFEDYVRTVRAGAEFRCRARDIRRDGSAFEVEVLGRGMSYQGKPAMLGVVRDVTEQVHAYRKLEQQADQHGRDLESLYHADEALHRSLRVEEVLQALVDVAANMMQADKSSVLVWDERHERLSVHAAHGFSAETIPRMSYARGEGISTRVAESGEPIWIEDVHEDPRIPQHIRAINEAESIRSLVSVPIKLGNEVLGVFNVHSARVHAFSGTEHRLLLGLAQRAALAIHNARVFAHSEQQRREIEALYRADEALYRSLELDDVLHALVEVVIDALGADKAMVLVWSPDRTQLIPAAARGYSRETIARLSFRPGEGIAGLVAKNGVTMTVEDALADTRTAPRINSITAPESVRSYMCVPILVKGEVFGVLSANYSEPRTFSDDDRRPLEALAQRAAAAVQNAELFRQAQRAATLEERARLARELHDAVTQTLFSASLIADVLPRLWDREPAQARLRLDELRRLNRGALAEMRTLLLELRPAALSETPLDELLRHLVEATMSRTAVALELTVDGPPSTLIDEVQVTLYRLAQEALNNLARHAQARHGRVVLQRGEDSVVLTITDDGCGFDPSVVPAGHLGLSIMHERAAAIEASLEIASRPGAGTRVTLAWPATAAQPSVVGRVASLGSPPRAS